jgi:hypothetical protein
MGFLLVMANLSRIKYPVVVIGATGSGRLTRTTVMPWKEADGRYTYGTHNGCLPVELLSGIMLASNSAG